MTLPLDIGLISMEGAAPSAPADTEVRPPTNVLMMYR